MNKKITKVLLVLGVLLLGISIFGVQKLLAGGKLVEELEIEYWSVCRGLPENAHWTGGNTDGLWKEIPQEETDLNVWGPIPIAEFLTGELDPTESCTFECDDGYEWDGINTCRIPIPTISISDDEYTFVIMDRNLGALEAGTGEDSYGRYFQRGNNYGFWNGIEGQTDEAGNESIVTSDVLVANALSYGPHNRYKSNVFITQPGVGGSSSYDYWDGGGNDNLRGGSQDDGPDTIPLGIEAENRQGPCPDGFHVPSQGEWNQLLITWASLNNITLVYAGGYAYVPKKIDGFMKFFNDFLLPLAGVRGFDPSISVGVQGVNGNYWSSSPSEIYARYFNLGSLIAYANARESRAYARSLRCFQNLESRTKKVACRGLPDNAHWTGGNMHGLGKKIFQEWTIDTDEWLPSSQGYYLTGDLDTTRYCTFECNEGYERDENVGACESILPIPTISISNGVNILEIMDRNLGALEAGTGEDSYGRYFQRGNNYGFWNGLIGQADSDGNANIITSTDQVDATNYGPGNYYKSNIFITANAAWNNIVVQKGDWSIKNNNLRGGSDSDGPDTISVGIEAENRQGPCPSGFHVPSQGEWNQLLIAYASQNGIALQSDNAGYKYFNDITGVLSFMEYFLLPLVGYRHYTSSPTVNNQGVYGYYWSSSPDGSAIRRLYLGGPQGVKAHTNAPRPGGLSLRCFKNPEYRTKEVACRGLPDNAHWTGGNIDETGKKIFQERTIETDAWLPSSEAQYLTEEFDSSLYCTFECDEGYEWEDGACVDPIL